MNEFPFNRNCSFATGARVGVAVAVVAASLASWPTREPPVYVSNHSEATFSSFRETLTFGPPVAHSFEQGIADVYAILSKDQEPLGAEFEAVWDANAAQLYNS